MAKIAIIGVGYVGLVSGLCFAKRHEVIFIDLDVDKINLLNDEKIPFYEPKLDELLKQVSTNTTFTTDLNTASNAELIFICVGTPTVNEEINLSYVKNACSSVGKAIKNRNTYPVVVIKSTVVPKTTASILLPILERYSGKKAGHGFGLCVNPEFLREGNAIEDFLEPDRIVIGALNEKDGRILSDFYMDFFGEVVLLNTNLNTAEMIKYCSNSFFPLLISFSNEFAEICERISNVDVQIVLDALSMDKRISPKIDGKFLQAEIVNYLKAGCGFGGSCFPKDLKALARFTEKINYKAELLHAVLSVNECRVQTILDRIEKKLGTFSGKKICILGLAFKPNTDDLRESPSIYLIEKLLDKNANVSAHDPMAINNAKAYFNNRENLEFSDDIVKALSGSDCCVVVTSWDEYKILNPRLFKEHMEIPFLIDCRRIYNKEIMNGYVYYYGTGLMPSEEK